MGVAAGHPGADGAAGAAAGTAPDSGQVAVAQGARRGGARGAVGGKAGRHMGLRHGVEAVHLLMGMPKASSMLSIAACATRGGTLGNEPRLVFFPTGRPKAVECGVRAEETEERERGRHGRRWCRNGIVSYEDGSARWGRKKKRKKAMVALERVAGR